MHHKIKYGLFNYLIKSFQNNQSLNCWKLLGGGGVSSRVIKFIDLGLFNTFMTPNQSPRGRPQNQEVLPCLVMFS